jgi:hypothetical protein
MGVGRRRVYITNQFQTTSVRGSRGEGGEELLAPVLFCTPVILLLKYITNVIKIMLILTF